MGRGVRLTGNVAMQNGADVFPQATDEVGQLLSFGRAGSGRFLEHAHKVGRLPAISEERLPDQRIANLFGVLQHFALHYIAEHQFSLFRQDVLRLASLRTHLRLPEVCLLHRNGFF